MMCQPLGDFVRHSQIVVMSFARNDSEKFDPRANCAPRREVEIRIREVDRKLFGVK